MTRHLDSGFGRPGPQAPRKSARISTSALVKMRRRGHQSLTVRVFDLSPEGCKLEFFEKPKLDETVWVKFEGLEILEATVCWIEDRSAGVEFTRPMHVAVFDAIVARLK